MDNHALFTDEPLRIICSGCGKEFYAEEISRCRVCGSYFCKECQKTHDCRKKTSETSIPSHLSPATPVNTAGTDADLTSPASENRTSLLPAVHAEKIPYKNTGMILSDDEAYSAYVREINPFIKCESCGEEYPQSDIWICPDCGAVLCQICRQKHKCPKPEGEQNKFLALLPFGKEKRISSPSALPEPKDSAENAASGKKSAAKPALPESKMLTCDHCGKIYPASKLKKCTSCGAVLCPRCRLSHSCSSKKDSEEKKQAKQTSAKKKEPSAPKKTAAAPKKTAAEKKDRDELIICDLCGEPYLKSKMRKCRTCGAVLCPKCRRKHTCKDTKE